MFYSILVTETMSEDIIVSYPVPYYAQIASTELAPRVFAGELDPLTDPRWFETGAATVEAYAYWVERACGMACLKMCVEALGGPVRSLHSWIDAGVKADAYLVKTNPDGSQTEIGWIHQKMADMVTAAGFKAECRQAAEGEIVEALEQDRLLIASVSYELGTDFPITHKGGHLVVIWGAEMSGRRVSRFILNNPSGRAPQYRRGARIGCERFIKAYTGRVIVIYK